MNWALPLLVALLIIVVGVLLKFNISVIMVTAGLVVALISRLTVTEVLNVAYATLSSRITQILFFSILLLELLAYLLKGTGAMQKIIDSLGRLLGDWRFLMAALAGVISALAVPGGAIMSAPMVEGVGKKSGFSTEGMAAANFWYRHVLYFSLPLFPSMILAAELSGVKVGIFTLYNFPLTLAGIILSFFTIFRGANPSSFRLNVEKDDRGPWPCLKEFLISSAPILIILVLVIAFQVLFPLAILIGVIVAFFTYLPKENNLGSTLKGRFVRQVLPGINFKTALMIVGIMFFQQILDYTCVVSSMAEYLVGTGAPALVLMFFIPFLMGTIVGDNSASIAIIMPLFIPLLDPSGPGYFSQLAFIYCSSTLGHLFTPVHPCLILTKEYFKVSFAKMLRPLMLPALLIFIMAVGEVILLGRVL